MKNQEYCIGLDIGTSSTGYAMTDMDGKLLKHKKRSTFGAVIYDSANTAAERRMKRSARRRLDRREQRIDLLQMLLAPDMAKVDSTFFLKLNESFLQNDERKYPLVYGTMPKAVWTDGSIEKYPTIYHLRAALTKAERQADIRYVYLALHHIIKYRGHFLMEGESLAQSDSILETITSVLEELSSEPYSYNIATDPGTISSIRDTLQQSRIRKSAKADQILSVLGPDKESKAAVKAFASLITGGTGSLKDLLGYENETPSEKLSFSSDWDEEKYIDVLETKSDLFEQIVTIYRWQLFSNLRADGETISQTMIRRYEKHQHDLKTLKSWVRTYAPDEYDRFFREVSEKIHNYCTYSGHYKQKNYKGRKIDFCSQADFYAAVKALLKSRGPEAQAAAQKMLSDMDEENGFMPLLRIYLNGSIPNQLHEEELIMILKQQSKYYPSLSENMDRIRLLCSFRLPYFVGPLNTKSPFQKWLVRSDEKPVTPWNFYQVVNKSETANGFIRNLTNKCTYLLTEDVVPLHSLLYEEYLMLDELNRIRINGVLLNSKLKERIIEGLFRQRKNVSQKAFMEWLKNNTAYIQSGELTITGFHGENGFSGSLSSYIDFKSWGFEINEETTPMIEQLIKWSTIFENRGILREKINETYPQLTEKQINSICRKRYTGWGRFSQTLLDGIQGENMAEGSTIIDMMRMTNDNFMRVINNSRYGFEKVIENWQAGNKDGSISLEEVNALQGSPALKRGIWQAAQIVDELVRHQGIPPKAIYIENTREESFKKTRTTDRIRQIEKLYTEEGFDEIPEECAENLDKCIKAKVRLTDRQFLYFIQHGKSMYSGKKLDFDSLEMYDVDHVLPQSYIKDDSIENRVLVLQNENRRKSDSLVLESEIQEKMRPFWTLLMKRNLIGRKKFYNLTRSTVEDNEKVGFINRQLVETSQIIKHVITLFKVHYPETDVRGINARLSSSLREAYCLYKIRELNNTHHAFDAFLACTIGTYTTKYLNWVTDESAAVSMIRSNWQRINKNQNKYKNGLILALFSHDCIDEETGEILRDAQKQISYLKQVWGYRDHFIVYKKEEKTGGFFNETRYPAGSVEAKFRLRKNLPVERYGGFSSINPAYIAAVSYKKGKKQMGTFVNVPIWLVKAAEKNPDLLIEEIKKDHPDYEDIHIVRSKILLNQKIMYENSELILRSCSEAWNGKELYLDRDSAEIIYHLINNLSNAVQNYKDKLDGLISILQQKLKTHYPVYSGISARLDAASEKINALTPEGKGQFILETLSIMQVSGQFAQYKKRVPEIGLSDNQGRINNKAFDISKVVLIDQSPTGFYERRTSLWAFEQS